MVRIIGGEIVADDDPRLTQRVNTHRPPPPSSTAAAGAARGRPQQPPGPQGAVVAGFDTGFDFNAPAVKMIPRPDAPGGIPDVELFALRVPGIGLLGVAGAGMFFGLRGLLVAAVLGYLYLRTSGGGNAAPTAPARTSAAAAPAGDDSGFLTPQHGFGSSSGGSNPAQRRQAPPSDKSSSVFKGKAYKLSGS